LSTPDGASLLVLLSRLEFHLGYGQSEPASMTAPVGRSVHRMGCVFHPPLLHATLTNILPQSIFLPADL